MRVGRQRDSSGRFLTTILFVDIVASTERAAQIGDAAWRALLDGAMLSWAASGKAAPSPSAVGQATPVAYGPSHGRVRSFHYSNGALLKANQRWAQIHKAVVNDATHATSSP
ncbi:MAG: hypothetical protein ACHQZR_01275 [Candidatus Limnocylindrales bacterium]